MSNDSFDQLQLEQAAAGAVSGTLAEWPCLAAALVRRGVRLKDTADAAVMQSAARAVLKIRPVTPVQLNSMTYDDEAVVRAAGIEQSYTELFTLLRQQHAPVSLYRFVVSHKITSRDMLWDTLATPWRAALQSGRFHWLLNTDVRQHSTAGMIGLVRALMLLLLGVLVLSLLLQQWLFATVCLLAVLVCAGNLATVAVCVRAENPYRDYDPRN